MLYRFGERVPTLLTDHYYIAESAEIIGSVIIADKVSILPQAVVRADNDIIKLGLGTNIQDGVIIHSDEGIVVEIGQRVSIGHRAVLHGCTIGDNCLIGIGATLLNRAKIGNNCIVGANALVLENQQIPDNSLVLGSPAVVKRQLSSDEITKIKLNAQRYIDKIVLYKEQLQLWK